MGLDPIILGSLISGAGGLLGGYLGNRASEPYRQQSLDLTRNVAATSALRQTSIRDLLRGYSESGVNSPLINLINKGLLNYYQPTEDIAGTPEYKMAQANIRQNYGEASSDILNTLAARGAIRSGTTQDALERLGRTRLGQEREAYVALSELRDKRMQAAVDNAIKIITGSSIEDAITAIGGLNTAATQAATGGSALSTGISSIGQSIALSGILKRELAAAAAARAATGATATGTAAGTTAATGATGATTGATGIIGGSVEDIGTIVGAGGTDIGATSIGTTGAITGIDSSSALTTSTSSILGQNLGAVEGVTGAEYASNLGAIEGITGAAGELTNVGAAAGTGGLLAQLTPYGLLATGLMNAISMMRRPLYTENDRREAAVSYSDMLRRAGTTVSSADIYSAIQANNVARQPWYPQLLALMNSQYALTPQETSDQGGA